MKISRELRVGLMAIVVLILTLIGLGYLRGSSLLSKNIRLFSSYKDADGLAAGNQVVLHGVQIGQVKVVKMDGTTKQVNVAFDLQRDIQIPQDSKAVITSLDLLGTKGLRIDLGKSTAHVQDKDSLVGSVEAGLTDQLSDQLVPLKQKVEKLLIEITGTTHSLNVALGDTNALQSIVQNAALITHHVAVASSDLHSILRKADSVTAGADRLIAALNRNGGNIDRTLNNTATITDSLKGSMTALKGSMTQLDSLMHDLNSGKGTAGKLLKDDAVYTNLRKSTEDLDRLLVDLKANPKRYVHFSVFGGGAGKKAATADSVRKP